MNAAIRWSFDRARSLRSTNIISEFCAINYIRYAAILALFVLYTYIRNDNQQPSQAPTVVASSRVTAWSVHILNGRPKRRPPRNEMTLNS